MKSNFILSDINRTLTRMVKTQRDLSSGKRVHKPSDDPSGTAKIIRLQGQIARYGRYEKSVDDSRAWLTTTESSVNTLLDRISDVNSTLIQASNGTLGEIERKALGEHVKEILDHVADIANKDYGGKYIFGGTETNVRPYSEVTEVDGEVFTSDNDNPVYLDAIKIKSGSVTVTDRSGGTTYTEGSDYTIDYEDGSITVLSTGSMSGSTQYEISYETDEAIDFKANPNGIDGKISREIDEDISMDINISGDDVFGGSSGLFKVLKDAYMALERNDVEGINSARAEINSRIDSVTMVLGEVGAKINRLDTLSQRLATDITGFKEYISSVQDTDIAESLVHLQNDQTVYQAALKTGASIMQSNLLDYL
ncbi:flagellar hook-associated protein FlgL [bacterium]|nr:flagellar hook-associated protein FlgL [bacterium]